MLNADRLRLRMADRGLSQSELARRVKVSQSAIFSLVSGQTYGSKHLHRIARELGTTPAYLEGETDDPDAGAIPDPSQEQIASHLDLVPITSIDLAYGMGGTFTDLPVEEDVMHFPRRWIQSITSTPPEFLTFVRGRGDSMSPTIHDEDMILVDRSQNRVRDQDMIWAITVGDIGMIKRLRLRANGVTILSDNERVPPDEATGDEVHIVGRVIYICHSV